MASHGLCVLAVLWLSATTAETTAPAPCSALYCYESPRTARATDAQERFVASRLHDRGPEYIALASKLAQRCLQVLQDRGDANADDEPDAFEVAFPYAWTAVQHLVAALESAPADAGVWDGALEVLLKLNSVDEELGLVEDHKLLKYARGAVELLARRGAAGGLERARQRVKQLLRARPHLASALQRWQGASGGAWDGPAYRTEERSMHEQAQRAATEWSKFGVLPDSPPPQQRGRSDASFRGIKAEEPPAAAADILPPAASHLLGSLTADRSLSLGGMDTFEVWPTRVSTIHLPTAMPKRVSSAFMHALNEAAEQAYRRHRAQAEAQAARAGDPKPDVVSINNGFFAAQRDELFVPGTGQHPERPSMFEGSREYAELQQLAYDMCVEHAMRSGKWRYAAAGQRQAQSDGGTAARREAARAWFARESKLYIWAAVYTNGTFHMPHQHEDSICSGVFYSRAEQGSSPIIFSDPRGGSIYSVSAQNVAQARTKTLEERRAQAAEPVAPFVHQYSVFPNAGDMVLFPSYLIHQVLPNPSAEREASRIVFAFNLYGDFDCWMRSNV